MLTLLVSATIFLWIYFGATFEITYQLLFGVPIFIFMVAFVERILYYISRLKWLHCLGSVVLLVSFILLFGRISA